MKNRTPFPSAYRQLFCTGVAIERRGGKVVSSALNSAGSVRRAGINGATELDEDADRLRRTFAPRAPGAGLDRKVTINQHIIRNQKFLGDPLEASFSAS
ncbi:MAG: hypothetical protein ABSE59_08765 [Opitutaceae bacterium]